MTQNRGTTDAAPTSDLRPPATPAITEARVGYHRLFLAVSIGVLCACVVLPAPNSAGELRLPGLGTPLPTLCMLKREFGVDCPGCGLTRCFISMGHGHVAAAWAYHPIGIAFFALLFAQIPYRLYQIRRLRQGRPELAHWTQWALLWLLVAALLGQWVLRIAGILTA